MRIVHAQQLRRLPRVTRPRFSSRLPMKQLWAPWRIRYILQPKPDTCFLCDAAAGPDDRAALVLARTERCLCMMNRYPYNPGHLLVAPNRHEGELDQLTPEEMADALALVQRSVSVLREAMSPEGFNVGANLGRVAGAGAPDHLHFHVVPRWNGDTNFMAVFADVKSIPQALEELYDDLRPRFASRG